MPLELNDIAVKKLNNIRLNFPIFLLEKYKKNIQK
jgi:hypothetical protein